MAAIETAALALPSRITASPPHLNGDEGLIYPRRDRQQLRRARRRAPAPAGLRSGRRHPCRRPRCASPGARGASRLPAASRSSSSAFATRRAATPACSALSRSRVRSRSTTAPGARSCSGCRSRVGSCDFRHVARLFDRLHDLAALPALGEAAAQPAGQRQLLDRLGRVAGDLQQLLVAQQALARDVDALGRALAPGGDLLQDAEQAGRGAARLQPPPGQFRVGAVGGRVVQHRHLLGDPAEPAGLLELAGAASRRPRAGG